MKVAPLCAPATLLIALGLVSTSCAAAQMAQTNGAVISLSNRKLFKFQRTVAGAPLPDEFTVDASSGEVVEALLHSHAIHDASQRRIAEAQARATAEEFGRTHFADFGQLSLDEATASGIARDGVPMYDVVWGRQAESGAWLPTSLHIGVDMETGQVVNYTVVRVDYRGPTVPVVSRERAIELALAEARKGSRLAHVTVNQVELLAVGPDQLAWFVELGNVPSDIFVRHFYLDALTGAILNPLGSPVG